MGGFAGRGARRDVGARAHAIVIGLETELIQKEVLLVVLLVLVVEQEDVTRVFSSLFQTPAIGNPRGRLIGEALVLFQAQDSATFGYRETLRRRAPRGDARGGRPPPDEEPSSLLTRRRVRAPPFSEDFFSDAVRRGLQFAPRRAARIGVQRV